MDEFDRLCDATDDMERKLELLTVQIKLMRLSLKLDEANTSEEKASALNSMKSALEFASDFESAPGLKAKATIAAYLNYLRSSED